VLPKVIAGRVHMNVALRAAVLLYAKESCRRLLAVLASQRRRFAPPARSFRAANKTVRHAFTPAEALRGTLRTSRESLARWVETRA
jgi:hypothetical protein